MEKVSHFIKSNYKYLLYISILIGVFLLFLYHTQVITFSSSKKIYFIILAVLMILFISVYSFIFQKKEKIKLENIYLIMIIPIGLMYLCIFPINQIPDENTHFARINEISLGYLISKKENNFQGRDLDANLYSGALVTSKYKDIINEIKIKNSNKKAFYHFANTALYSFISYIPQVLGLLVGKIFHLPILLQAYMARLFNFLVFVFLTYLAIKIIPVKKMAIFIIMFFPLVIQEAISLSPDALTIAITAFLIAYVLNLKQNTALPITKKDIVILSICSIVLSLCKIVYFPICFIVFLIPKEKFKSNKHKLLTVSFIILLALIVNLIWLSISSEFLPSGQVNSKQQIQYIFRHIPRYIMAIFATYTKCFNDWFFNSIGNSLGNFNIVIPAIYLYPLLVLFICTVFLDNSSSKYILNIYEKIIIAIIIVTVLLLITTSLYLQWTPVAAPTVFGIQGRYFVPIYLLLPMLFFKHHVTPKINYSNKYVYLYIITLNLLVVSSVFYHFI